jgi:hypothetical protein
MPQDRERLETGTDKRYVRRDEAGQFEESTDVGRSHAQDQRREAESITRPGQGDRGDRDAADRSTESPMAEKDRSTTADEARRRDGPAPTAEDHPDEAGAYIGRLPEREADSIPGGARPDEERIAVHGSSGGDVPTDDAAPEGHREGRPADDATIREAGLDR